MAKQESASFIWPSKSTKDSDGVIAVLTTRMDGQELEKGNRSYAPGNELYDTWLWMHKNQNVLPPNFDDDLEVAVKAYLEMELSAIFRQEPIQIPQKQIAIFVHAYWSSASEWAMNKLEKASITPDLILKIDPLPKDKTWGYLMPFCQGYGEFFIFDGGECRFYMPLARYKSKFAQFADLIRGQLGSE